MQNRSWQVKYTRAYLSHNFQNAKNRHLNFFMAIYDNWQVRHWYIIIFNIGTKPLLLFLYYLIWNDFSIIKPLLLLLIENLLSILSFKFKKRKIQHYFNIYSRIKSNKHRNLVWGYDVRIHSIVISLAIWNIFFGATQQKQAEKI